MNKFVAIALLAFVAVASAQDVESQNGVDESIEAKEIANLKPEHKQFEDYCIEMRRDLWESVTRSADETSSELFGFFFKSVGDIGQDIVKTISEANSRFTATLRQRNSEIQPAEDEVSAILKEAQEEIQQTSVSQPQAFAKGFTATLRAVTGKVATKVTEKYNNMLESLKRAGLAAEYARKFCVAIEKFDGQFKSSFEYTKVELGLDDVEYDKVGCRTTRRVARIDSICKIYTASQPHLQRLLVTIRGQGAVQQNKGVEQQNEVVEQQNEVVETQNQEE